MKNAFNVSFQFGVDPGDTEETTNEKIDQMKTLFAMAQKMGVTLHVTCSTDGVKDQQTAQRECFNALKAQNAGTVTNLTAWSSIIGLSLGMIRRVFTGHEQISAATLKAIECAASENRIRCDEETLTELRDLANA